MPLETVGTGVLILLGAVVMALSLPGTRRILALLGKGPYARKWRVLFVLMLFFLVGYLLSLVLILSGFSRSLALLTGVIFLCGAAFVRLVVRVGGQTIGDLLASTVSRAHFEKIIESMAGALVVTDPDLTIRTVNDAAVQLTGYDREELIGMPADVAFAECDLFKQPDELLRMGSLRDIEKACRTKSGETKTVSGSGGKWW